jgi:hypothetical protein
VHYLHILTNSKPTSFAPVSFVEGQCVCSSRHRSSHRPKDPIHRQRIKRLASVYLADCSMRSYPCETAFGEPSCGRKANGEVDVSMRNFGGNLLGIDSLGLSQESGPEAWEGFSDYRILAISRVWCRATFARP